MVNDQLGELLDCDVLFVAPDQGQSNSGERSANIAYCDCRYLDADPAK